MLLKNKTAIITGCNKGIGKEILKLFSENGAKVIACVRKIDEKFNEELDYLQNKNKCEIIPLSFDLMKEDEVKDAAKKILALCEKIDIMDISWMCGEAMKRCLYGESLKELYDSKIKDNILR